LRDRPDVQRLGAGYSLSRSTAHRYPDEARRVLTDQAPDIKEALDLAAARGYDGAGCGVLTAVPQRTDGIPSHVDTRTRNNLLRGLRCLGERGFALPTERWKALEHVTMSPRKITQITRAALVLTQYEHKPIS
jgi:hypothetical protein